MFNLNKPEVAMNNQSFPESSCIAVKEVDDEAAATCSGGVAYTGSWDPDVVLFQHGGLQGRTLRVNASINDGILNIGTNGNFNDMTSSLVIQRGQWAFFADSGYRGYYTTLGPGVYTSLPPGFSNDQLTSLYRVG